MPLREVELMRDLKHPNIIQLVEVIEDTDSIYLGTSSFLDMLSLRRQSLPNYYTLFLVLELADKPVIQQEQQSKLQPEMCRGYFAQLVDAVDYRESRK